MELWLANRGRLVFLVTVCALLASVEALIPLFRYRQGRLRRSLPNVGLALGVVFTNLLFATFTASTLTWISRNGLGLLSRIGSHRVILIATGIAGLDLFAYAAHRLLHKVPVGWRFHRAHH